MINESYFHRLIRNSIICNQCKDEIVSTYTHHHVFCRCGLVSVDGGTSYQRRTFNGVGYTDSSVFRRFTIEELRNEIDKATYVIQKRTYSTDFANELLRDAKRYLLEWYGLDE